MTVSKCGPVSVRNVPRKLDFEDLVAPGKREIEGPFVAGKLGITGGRGAGIKSW